MKITGTLRTYTEDKQILEEPIGVRIHNGFVKASIDGKMLAFVIHPLYQIGNKLVYSLSEVFPLYEPPKLSQEDLPQRYLIVSMEG